MCPPTHRAPLAQVTFEDGREHLDTVLGKLKTLVQALPGAEGEIEEMTDHCKVHAASAVLVPTALHV